MNGSGYIRQIVDSIERLNELVQQRKSIEMQMAKLRELIKANANLLPPDQREAAFIAMDEVSQPIGLTDAIRRILREAGRNGLSPTEVRDALEASGHDLSLQSNALSSIHTILKRLLANSEARASGEGKDTTYEWIGETALGVNWAALLGEDAPPTTHTETVNMATLLGGTPKRSK